jgi:hypothetical protein
MVKASQSDGRRTQVRVYAGGFRPIMWKVLRRQDPLRTTKPSHSFLWEGFTKPIVAYGLGELVVDVSVFVDVPGEEPVFTVVFDSVLLEAAGDSFTIVVLLSFLFSPGGLVTVVSLCSQAASNAAPAKMQIYFFMTEAWTATGPDLFKGLVMARLS